MVQVRVVRNLSPEPNVSIRVLSKIPTNALEAIKVPLPRCKTKLPHSHGTTVDVIASKRDGPLEEGTNEALVVLDALIGKFFSDVEFRMIILVNWRSPFLGKGSKDRDALVDNSLDIGLSSPCESAIRVSEEVTTKMIGYLPNSLKLIALISEFLLQELGIRHDTGKVINIDTKRIHNECHNLASRHQDQPCKGRIAYQRGCQQRIHAIEHHWSEVHRAP